MLLLDLGNSSLKAQYWQSGKLQSSCRLRMVAGWQIQLTDYLSQIDASHCYYAAVTGSQLLDAVTACLQQQQFMPVPLQSLARMGKVINAYARPETMGVDRWLALLGVAALVETDAIVVDAGTAITIDLLKANGLHLGGAIMPGLNTSLGRFQQILLAVDFSHPAIHAIEKPGVSTESCIHLHHSPGDINYLQQLIRRWFNHMDKNATLVVAGGDAQHILQPYQHHRLFVPDLVFVGMRQQLEYLEHDV